MTPLRFTDLEGWEAAAERRIPCQDPAFVVRTPAGEKLAVRTALSIHEDATVLGTDWLPVRPDGLTTLQQLTYTPPLFLGKARNLVQQASGDWAIAARSRRRLDDSAVLAGCHPNYYHWLVGHLPRLLFAHRHGLLEGRLVLLEAGMPDFVLESLRRIGITGGRLEHVAADEALEVEELVVPAMLLSNTVAHPLVPELVREALRPGSPSKGRRIYLSRQDAGSRQLANEEELVRLLASWGFEHHLPSRMSLQEQVDACAGAEAIVAVHGAALTNMLFAPRGTRVIEIYTPSHPATFFLLLAHVCGHDHRFVPAGLVDPRPDMSPLYHRQWEADLGALRAALAEMLPR